MGAASKVSDRDVYAGVVEHSVYVDSAGQARGVGRLLLTELVAATEAAGIWTIQAGIFPRTPRACGCTGRPASRWSASVEV